MKVNKALLWDIVWSIVLWTGFLLLLTRFDIGTAVAVLLVACGASGKLLGGLK